MASDLIVAFSSDIGPCRALLLINRTLTINQTAKEAQTKAFRPLQARLIFPPAPAEPAPSPNTKSLPEEENAPEPISAETEPALADTTQAEKPSAAKPEQEKAVGNNEKVVSIKASPSLVDTPVPPSARLQLSITTKQILSEINQQASDRLSNAASADYQAGKNTMELPELPVLTEAEKMQKAREVTINCDTTMGKLARGMGAMLSGEMMGAKPLGKFKCRELADINIFIDKRLHKDTTSP